MIFTWIIQKKLSFLSNAYLKADIWYYHTHKAHVAIILSNTMQSTFYK